MYNDVDFVIPEESWDDENDISRLRVTPQTAIPPEPLKRGTKINYGSSKALLASISQNASKRSLRRNDDVFKPKKKFH